ncbi:MAG: C13 family peptidase [Caldilineaceae bacterium]
MHRRLRWSFVVILVLLGGILHLNTPEQSTLAMAGDVPAASASKVGLDLGPLQDIVQISAGYEYTCALTSSGGVKCWGRNTYGQLGNNSRDDSNVPVDVSGLTSGVRAISAGLYHTCALTTTGGVKCWGANGAGQLGNGSVTASNVPVDVSGLTSGVNAISASGWHTCAVTTTGGAKCWGDNYDGQLGNNSRTSSSIPVDVDGLASGVSTISAVGFWDGDLDISVSYTCVLTTAGGVKCWGRNDYGQLGNNSTVNSLVPVDVSSLSTGISAISANGAHVCALTTVGGAKCWGRNSSSELGNNSTTNSSVPVDVSGLTSSVNAISAGGGFFDPRYVYMAHTCALTTVGGVKCWGNNYYSQLGDSNRADASTPVDVSDLASGITAISSGGLHTCVITTSSGVKCWGSNYYGQLGNGLTGHHPTPTGVSGLISGTNTVSAGYYSHTCALTTMGGVKCWGNNSYGQLGNNSTYYSDVPVDVSSLNRGVSAISAGYLHTCALTMTGGVKCWGSNYYGELGNNSTIDSSVPVDVSGLSSGVSAITAGFNHTCALTVEGGVKCWGRNGSGALGNNSTVNSPIPVDVSSLSSGVSAISAGDGHTCAVTTTGGLKCWGWNGYGQLGNNSTTSSKTPVNVSGLSSGVSAVGAGYNHTCALTTSGGVKCWGDRDVDGNAITISKVPVDVSGLSSGVKALSVHRRQICSLLTTGGVKCWGNNYTGPYFSDATMDTDVPIDVSGFSNEIDTISVGGLHACVVTKVGGVECWGRNEYGQLGKGIISSITPVDVLDPNAPAVTPTSTATPTAIATNTITPTSTIISTSTATPTATATTVPDATATSTATATPSATATATATATPASDSHEPNDTCDQAQSITTDGTSQTHTFQREGDVDWVRFDATQGTRYRIEVEIPYGSPADVNLGLYAACDALPLEQWNEPYAPGARLAFEATTTQPVYVRLENVPVTVYGAHVTYQLTVHIETARQVGALIIVAGRLRGADQLQRNIHNVTESVYKLFQANGYTNADIQYLATDSTLVGYSAPATAANLKAAITTWATTRVGPERALTIYMMDHGAVGKFYIDDLNREYVTPVQLNEWLTQLETQVPGVKVNLILEACHAGSFIRGTASLSKAGRVIVASTNLENDAYASQYGAHFSDQLLAALSQGKNLYTSFWHARTTVRRLFSFQDPWIDADGDQNPNQPEDAALAAERGFGQPGSFPNVWPPYVVTVTAPLTITNGRGEIEAEVRDNESVRNVWAVIYPPSYTPTASSDELVAEALDTILLRPQGGDRYRGAFAGFTEIGVYRIAIHAVDQQELEAQPILVEIAYGNQLYLPLVLQK